MAKKNLLKANLKRPTLKREMKVTEEKMDEVVRKVADDVPATTPAAKSATVPVRKQGRGRPKKETAAPTAPRSVHPKQGTKRLTLDVPHDLHKRLKLLAIHQEISMKDYIIQVVERSLGNG